MFLTRWLKFPTRSRTRRGTPSRPRFRPSVEGLEVREVPATLTVTTTADVIDPNDGLLSLREAVIQANASNGNTTIVVPTGVYRLTLLGGDENAGMTGDLDITGNVTIQGAGAGATVIDGNGRDRVFDVAASAEATLSGLTIQGG